MRRLFVVLIAFFRMSLQTMFQYRAEMVLWAVWGVIYPAVAMAMWSSAVRGAEGGVQIGGYGPREFAGYFLATMWVGHLATAWDMYEMSYLIRTGQMSTKLLLPILPMWASLADNVAYKALTLAILAPLWLLVAWVAQPVFATTWTHFVLGSVAACLGAALSYLWGYNLALMAFWVTRMEAISQLWFGASLFFGGRIAPLSIMPEPLQWFAAKLPFQWTIYFPSVVLIGRVSFEDIARGLLIQSFWLVLALITFRVLWRNAVRQYSAVGA